MKDLSNENIIHIKKEEVEYIQFRKLLKYPEISHAYSIGLDRNFKKEKIELEKEYQKICGAIEENYIEVIKPIQKHSANVEIVNNKVNQDMPDLNEEMYENIDGLITNQKNIILSTTNADCILFLIYDPVKKVIANVHSGWKGTLQKIVKRTIEKMIKDFDCNIKDILVCICPSIRQCHFEVEKDVKDLFENEFGDILNGNKERSIIETKKDLKWNIDTIGININLLIDMGVKQNNIIDSKLCSVCNSDKIHSYRVEKIEYMLNTAIIKIKGEN